MNLKLETEFSKADILQQVDALKKQIDSMHPLPEDIEGRVMQKLRLDWNYNSNAIEGNKLSYGETVAFLMEGITAKGKPLKDHLDIRGHNNAINFLLSIVKETRPISETDIRSLHEMILVEPYDSPAKTPDGLPTTKRITLGEYKKQPNHVKTATGELHYYATPEETPAKMQDLLAWYNEATSFQIHPLVIAALFHHKFVAIHPFDDGNGRLSRILMNLILMKNGYPPAIIKIDDRQNYYSLLSRADIGDSWPFIEYMAELSKSSQQLFVKAANGGDIDDDDDIDKEIALFKLEVQENTNVKVPRSNAILANILVSLITPLFENLEKKAENFKELFIKYSSFLGIGSFESLAYSSITNFLNETTTAKKDEIFDSLQRIALTISFERFKNADNDFNVKIWLRIEFDEYYYKVVSMHDKIILSKFYHERLSAEEEKIITKNFIENLKDEIKNQLNEKGSKF